MFHFILVRCKRLEQYVFKLRSDEYHRGYNEGARIQNGIDIMTRTVRLHDGRVTSIRGLLNILRDTFGLMKLKDEQIELLQNRVASMQGIIELLTDEGDFGDDR